MRMDRRGFLSAASSSLAATVWPRLAESTDDAASRTRLILLGTKGGPSRTPTALDRHLPSQVLLIRGAPYVVDCGLGATDQLVRAGVPLRSLRHIFITHHHSDQPQSRIRQLVLYRVGNRAHHSGRRLGTAPLAAMTREFITCAEPARYRYPHPR